MKRKFDRAIPETLIEQLNTLVEDQESWWNFLVNKDDTFIAVRPGYISVYTGGGSLLKIMPGKNNGLICQTHQEYLFLKSTKPYVDLNSDNIPQVCIIDSIEKLIQNYPSAQRRIRLHMGLERQGVGKIAARIPNVIDIEVTDQQPAGESLVSEGVSSKKGSIDLAAVDSHGVLWFYEAKLLGNPELRASKGTPLIIGQLNRYAEWIARKSSEIVPAFNNLRDNYTNLKGHFFKERVQNIPKIKDVRKRPILLVFGFDRAQQKKDLPSVLGDLYQCGLSAKDVITIGNPENLTVRGLFVPNTPAAKKVKGIHPL